MGENDSMTPDDGFSGNSSCDAQSEKVLPNCCHWCHARPENDTMTADDGFPGKCFCEALPERFSQTAVMVSYSTPKWHHDSR